MSMPTKGWWKGKKTTSATFILSWSKPSRAPPPLIWPRPATIQNSLLLATFALPLGRAWHKGGEGKPRQTWEVPDRLLVRDSKSYFFSFPHLGWLPLVHLGDHGQVEDHRVKQVHQITPKNEVEQAFIYRKQKRQKNKQLKFWLIIEWRRLTSPPPSPGQAGSLAAGWSPSFAGNSYFPPPRVGSWRDTDLILDESLLFSVAAPGLATVFPDPISSLAKSSKNRHLSACPRQRLCWKKSALQRRWMWQTQWKRQSRQSLAFPCCPTAACLLFWLVLNGSYICSGHSERGRNLCVITDYTRIKRD